MTEGEADAPTRRVAVFGGSFNPPHVAHVLGAVYALSTLPVDAVLVVPVHRHAFGKPLAPYEHRLAMCRLAFEWIEGVTVSTIEGDLGGESLTLRTLEHLTVAHPRWSLRLLIGADVLPDLPKWHRFDRIAAIAPPLVLGRAGSLVGTSTLDAGPQVLPEVSSTELRAALEEGRFEDVRPLVPRAVLDYIERHGLYQAPRG